MTPIIKNVCVVDDQGNQYEATYPRRAKGLVKNGRARFLSENIICLACPPSQILRGGRQMDMHACPPGSLLRGNKILEDHDMSENIQRTENVNLQNEGSDQYITRILELTEQMQLQTDYINNAIGCLSQMPNGDSGAPGAPGDIMGEAKARAYENIVRSREETNRMILTMYMQIYNDCKLQSAPASANTLEAMDDSNNQMSEEQSPTDLRF